MALGTPISGTVAYSAAGGTTVSPAYPAGIAAGDAVLVILGQKPSTANSGSVTMPAGWTLVDSLSSGGGYGTTLGADTGNTNLFIYAKDVVNGTETGNLAITLGFNNISWAFMVRVPVGAGVAQYGGADGQRTTAPTAGTPFTVALTNGASPTNFQAGDLAIWAMCIPSDVTTPSQFSAQSVTATGATFGTAVEFNEPDSQTGNDIGGYSAYATVTAGSSTAAPSVTVTAAGTVTNVRGPVVMARVREIAPPAQGLSPSLYTNTNGFFAADAAASNALEPARYDNANAFHNPTVAAGAINLAPARYDNTNAFYAADITQQGGAQSLIPALYANNNTFYATSVTAATGLLPSRFDNSNTFLAASITSTRALTAALYTNTNSFFAPTVSEGAVTLAPARYDNSNAFYAVAIGLGGTPIAPSLYANTNDFFAPSITATRAIAPSRYDNANAFYSATIGQTIPAQSLLPSLYSNTNAFYAPTAAAQYALRFEGYSQAGYVDPGYTGLALQSPNQFFAPALAGGTVTIVPNRYDNTNAFFGAAVVVPGQSYGSFFAVF